MDVLVIGAGVVGLTTAISLAEAGLSVTIRTAAGPEQSTSVAAGAVWGLAVWLCEFGSARFGVCADKRCGNVYLDTSSNCCRRFCSERCATRSRRPST